MRKHEIVTVALRLLAVVLIYRVLESAPRLFAYQGQISEPSFIYMQLLAGSQALAAIALFIWAPACSGFLLSREADSLPVPAWSKEQVLETALIVIGIYFFVQALLDASYWVVLRIALAHAEYGAEPMKPERVANIASTLVELGLSSVMVFMPKSPTRLVR
jgi:hypothetical protein